MKAAVYRRFGGPEVVAVEDVPDPVPLAGEVLVRVRATTVSAGDHRGRALDLPPGMGLFGPLAFGFGRPRNPVLGCDFAGIVEAVGDGVTDYRAGDPVFGSTDGFGCHAELVRVKPGGAIAHKPDGVTFEDAASVMFGGGTALHFLRKAPVTAGERVLVNGASGATGVAFVQTARSAGAVVTGVCSRANAELVRSLGASEVLAYDECDPFAAGAYDAVVDTVGNVGYPKAKVLLKAGGRLLAVMAGLADLALAPLRSRRGPIRVVAGMATPTADDVRTLGEMLADGRLRGVIDSRFALGDMVEAHRRVDTGRKRGSVVVTIA